MFSKILGFIFSNILVRAVCSQFISWVFFNSSCQTLINLVFFILPPKKNKTPTLSIVQLLYLNDHSSFGRTVTPKSKDESNSSSNLFIINASASKNMKFVL